MRLEQCPLPGGGSLTVYLRDAAQAMPNALRRPVVVVVPGGGYNHVSAREADPVALQFAAAGYHTAILTYRVGEGARHYQPLRQLNAAIGLLRSRAEAWNLLPEKIAVCGFSAGGHLALSGWPTRSSRQENMPTGAVLSSWRAAKTLPPNSRSRWRTRSHPPHRRSSSGIPWRTRRCLWKTPSCC